MIEFPNRDYYPMFLKYLSNNHKVFHFLYVHNIYHGLPKWLLNEFRDYVAGQIGEENGISEI